MQPDGTSEPRERGPAPGLPEEVFCGAVGVFLEEAERAGIDPAPLLEGVPYSAEHLRGRRTWMDWASFARFLSNAGRVWNDEELARIGSSMIWAWQFRPLIAIASMVWSPADFTVWMSRTGGKRVFTCVEVEVETIAPNELVVTQTVPDGYSLSREFGVISRGVHRAIPTLFGFSEGIISEEPVSRGHRFRVRYSSRRPRGSRLRSWLNSLRWSRKAAREIKEAYEELEQRCEELSQEIRARKAAEEENARWAARVELTQRLESLGLLAGGVAHDFNNLLVGMQGNAELILRAADPGSETESLARELLSSTERASGLTEQLLAYAGKAEVHLERVQLATLVEQSIELIRSGVARATSIEHAREGEEVWIDGDVSQLSQVIVNLLTNAVEAANGRPPVVRVHTGLVDARRDYLDGFDGGAELAEGTYAQLEVADNGCGMDEEVLAKIFEPFYTTKSQGHGLGLAATVGIVHAHGGALSATSVVGEGTTFQILLPASSAAGEAAPTRSTELIRGEGTVLVIEDEPPVQRVIEKMLRSLGFSVLVADDGESGIDLLRGNSDEIRAVVLDLTMPGIDGLETFAQLQGIRADMPVLFYSGYSRAETPLQDQPGGAAFLRKPFTLLALSDKLRELLDR